METLSEATHTALVYMFVFLLLGEATADQQYCQTVHSVKNRALNGHVIKRFEDTSVEKCSNRCEEQPDCYSVNYIVYSKSCELNKATRESHPQLFLPKLGTVYLDSLHRHYHTYVQNPCQNEGSCILKTQEPRYKCNCLQKFSGDNCENCEDALGMYDKTMPDSAISSSTFEPESPPHSGRIYLPGGWRALSHDTKPYLEIQLQSMNLLTAVATQGWKDPKSLHSNCWTKEYYLEYTVDGNTWEKHPRNDKTVFKGNKNAEAYVKNRITHPFLCKALRIRPVTWEHCPAMRTELYGCHTS